MNSKYNYLLNIYPEMVSKEQLCKICHISKRKATWLLENGFIPCTDTGKKTRRFWIKMVDVIYYLENKDKHPEKYITPQGIFSSELKQKNQQENLITSENFHEYKRFVEKEMKSIADVMTTTEAAEVMMTKDLSEKIKGKKLKAYSYKARNVITKKDLLDSYFKAVKENNRCYQKFHLTMVKNILNLLNIRNQKLI